MRRLAIAFVLAALLISGCSLLQEGHYIQPMPTFATHSGGTLLDPFIGGHPSSITVVTPAP